MNLRSSEKPARRVSWVMGGIHMTANSFVPTSLLKVTLIFVNVAYFFRICRV